MTASWTKQAKSGVATSCTERTSAMVGIRSLVRFTLGGSADIAGLEATSFLRIAHEYMARIWLWHRTTSDADKPRSSSSNR